MINHSILHGTNIIRNGKSAFREAVRAVVIKDDSLLMIYSPVNGDYKFPGGGIEEGENHYQALKRELMEEAGSELTIFGRKLGLITEIFPSREPQFDIFTMNSFYYLCSVSDERPSALNLDDYEDALGFTPQWVSAAEAIHNNESILLQENHPRWTQRETYFLKELQSSVF